MIIVGGEALIDLVPAPAGGPRAWRALPGGSPANTAVAAARLGHPTGFLARLSTDVFGEEIRGHLADSGVPL
ncbi:MAG: carbohydrate kinase, partial [Acidothermales bacterium]|nr:carbohydrate kinase [Acidothermales bacterium]